MLPAAEKADNTSYHAELLTQVARAQGLQRKFDEAHATLDRVDALINDATMPVARVRYLLERGRVFNSAGDPGAAKPLFESALELARRCGAEYHAVDAAHMLGIVEKGTASLLWNRKAIAMAEAAEEPHAHNWLGSLYNNTGWTYHDMGDYDNALDLFKKSLAWRQQQQDAEGTRIAKWCIARTYRSLGELEPALDMQMALLREHDAAGTNDGYVHEELGECLYALDRKDESRAHFAKAHELLSQDPWLAANEPERLQRLERLARGRD